MYVCVGLPAALELEFRQLSATTAVVMMLPKIELIPCSSIFGDKILLCSLGWPWTQDSLSLVSRVLVLEDVYNHSWSISLQRPTFWRQARG